MIVDMILDSIGSIDMNIVKSNIKYNLNIIPYTKGIWSKYYTMYNRNTISYII